MRPWLQTNYFYYRRYLDRRNYVSLELYSYLMAKRFRARMLYTLTGIYFDRPVDGTLSNDIVQEYKKLSLIKRLLINIKAKLTYPKE